MVGGATIEDASNNFLLNDLEYIFADLANRSAIRDASIEVLEERFIDANTVSVKGTLVGTSKTIDYTYSSLATTESIDFVVDSHCGVRIPPKDWTIYSSSGSLVRFDSIRTTQVYTWFEDGYELSLILRLKEIPAGLMIPESEQGGQGIWHGMFETPQSEIMKGSEPL